MAESMILKVAALAILPLKKKVKLPELRFLQLQIYLADVISPSGECPSKLSLRTCRHVIDGQWLSQLVSYQQPLQGGNDGGVAVDLSCCDADCHGESRTQNLGIFGEDFLTQTLKDGS